MNPEVEQFLRDLIECAQNTYDPQIGVYAARAATLLETENTAKAVADQGHRPVSEPVEAGRFLVERDGVDGGYEYFCESAPRGWVTNWREADLLDFDEALDVAREYPTARGRWVRSEVEAENAGYGL